MTNAEMTVDQVIDTYRTLELAFMDAEITVSQWRVLNFIVHQPGCSNKGIAEHLRATPPNVSMMLARMNRAGLISTLREAGKVEAPNQITATQKGIDAHADGLQRISTVLADCIEN